MIKVYDINMQLVAYLENAFAIGYEQRLNELWTASFSLPSDDPKNEECTSFRFIEIFDNSERVEIFRIVPTKTERSDSNQTISYQCEHVLSTLLDDVMFQYHQVGGAGVSTSDVIQYVLDQQSVIRWQLGTVDFAEEFEYKFENENLLGSIFAIPKVFLGAYQWTWDTTTTPWTLNLIEPESGDPTCYIRYGKNLIGVTKEEDPTTVCTRLYCLGYGEGVNQLKISEVNDGLPYLDADTQGTYGVISCIFTDRRIEHPETLKARGEAILEAMKVPLLTYSVSAADISQLTEDFIDKFTSGALVRVIDEELGIDVISRVVSVRKTDIIGQPWDAQIEIANKTANIVGSIAELENRQRINEVNAQGATNLDSHDFAENCDPAHPAVIRFYLPEETVRVNKMILSYKTDKFRAYSRAMTSGNSAVIDGNGSVHYGDNLISGGMILGGYMTGMIESTAISGVSVSYDGVHGHGASTDPAGDPEHTHGVNIGPSGGHSHSVDVPSHTHRIASHSHFIDHTHDILYGIYEGPVPTALTVEVDGYIIPLLGTNEENVDIVPYLSKDSEGKIHKGAWHEIKITPNDLGRVVANVVTQIFVQSRGGGNY